MGPELYSGVLARHARYMEAPTKAVLFDVGFTLLQPADSVANTYRHHAASLGCAPPAEAFRARFREVWRTHRTERAGAAGDLRSSPQIEAAQWFALTQDLAAPFPDLAHRHAEWLAGLVAWFDRAEAWRLTAGAQETLSCLQAAGCRLAVVSNWHPALHGILHDLGLASFFESVVLSAEVGFRKPSPRPFAAALEALDVPPNEAVHVGDSVEEDLKGARNASIRALLYAPEGSPSKNQAQITTLDEIPARLGLIP